MAALRTLFGLILLAALVPIARAGCTGDQPNWLWNYEGVIGKNYRALLTLKFDSGKVDGEYLYVSRLKDIALRGDLAGSALRLEELGPDGAVTAFFEGTVDRDCEKFEGNWQKTGGTEKLPFQFKLINGVSGKLDDRYGGNEDVIHANVLRFWEAVKAGRKQTVAGLIVYPIRVSVNGRPVKLRNAKQFVAQYDAIFSNRYRNAIAEAVPRNMFSKSGQIMLGRGEVWFNKEGKVFALNN